MPREENSAVRRTRKQVARACDFCRMRRIGCDNGQPCKACLQRGQSCTTAGYEKELRSLPAAQREIERLRQKIKDLEIQVSELKGHSSEVSQPSSVDNVRNHNSRQLSTPSEHQWEGVYVATTASDQKSYYGPSSLYYLASRMSCYLDKKLQQPCTQQSLQPRSGIQDNIYQSSGADDRGRTSHHGPSSGYLGRAEEESILQLFWEGYHCILPIVDEVAFQTLYASLWEPTRPIRRACPLVDIILALCLQNGYAYIPVQISRKASGGDGNDGGTAKAAGAAMAGRSYFMRAQSGIAADLESPSTETVQTYIFLAAYLCCASFHNMCHVTLAQAVQIAHIVGLHLDPPQELLPGERERRRRIWWVLCSLAAKSSTKHGRPLMVDHAYVTTALPSDDSVTAAYHSTLGFDGSNRNVTWLSYARQNQKLHVVMADIHRALFAHCNTLLRNHPDLTCIYHDPSLLEEAARFLATRLPAMHDWIDEVPSDLQTRRRGGQPYSTDRSALDRSTTDGRVPVWLQLQSIWLELTYHSLMVQITRFFITFYKQPGTYTPTVHRHAATCVVHAVAFTHLMHQTVTETDLLGGWTELFSLQWGATLVMVAFVLAYPVHVATPRARAALKKAMAIFDIYGENFAVSADAATICRDLMAKADRLGGWDDSTARVANCTPPLQQTAADENLAWLNPCQPDAPNGTYIPFDIDWAIAVDNFNSFERFFDTRPVDLWALTPP